MSATYMTALHIHSVRHLHEIDIPLSTEGRKSLILTGKNGNGKTSVLRAVKDFLEFLVGTSFQSEEAIQSDIDYSESQINSNAEEDTCKMSNAQRRVYLERYKKKLEHWTTGAVAEFPSYADLREKYAAGKYVLAYYGDDRAINVEISKNSEKIDLPAFYPMQAHPSRQLVKYLVNLKTTQAFAQAKGDKERADAIENWFARFEGILKELYNDPSLKLDFDIDTFTFSILLKNRQPVDFNTLSMGYAAVFDIVGDLIMRMETQKDYSLEGLVLIDEIETHLHVDLQKQIVPILMKLFPNIQFVLTTHSAFILNSTPNAVVYDLGNRVLVKEGLTDLPYEGIVEGYFSADLLSQELREKFEQYKTLVEKAERTDADFAKAAELESYLDEVPDYLALNFAAEYNRLKAEFADRG